MAVRARQKVVNEKWNEESLLPDSFLSSLYRMRICFAMKNERIMEKKTMKLLGW